MSALRKRHPIRAFFGGLFVGLGVALDVATYGARSARSRYATA